MCFPLQPRAGRLFSEVGGGGFYLTVENEWDSVEVAELALNPWSSSLACAETVRLPGGSQCRPPAVRSGSARGWELLLEVCGVAQHGPPSLYTSL